MEASDIISQPSNLALHLDIWNTLSIFRRQIKHALEIINTLTKTQKKLVLFARNISKLITMKPATHMIISTEIKDTHLAIKPPLMENSTIK